MVFTLLTSYEEYLAWARSTFAPEPVQDNIEGWNAFFIERDAELLKKNEPEAYPVLATDIVADMRYEVMGPLYVTVADARRLLSAVDPS